MNDDLPKLVLEAVAAVRGIESQDIDIQASIAETLDSLGLLTVIGHVESTCDTEFDSDETAQFLLAENIEDLTSLFNQVLSNRNSA